ncbi:hypothetical protein ABTZ99_26185 [Actinosynnema sp. NPDC002837]
MNNDEVTAVKSATATANEPSTPFALESHEEQLLEEFGTLLSAEYNYQMV